MNRRTFVAGAGAAFTGSLAGCISDLAGEPVSESVSNSYTVSQETTVAISNRNGPVTSSRPTGMC